MAAGEFEGRSKTLGKTTDRPPQASDWTPARVRDLRAAARRGDAEALAELGSLYEDGWGVRRDLRMAKRCYEQASELGDPEAMYALAGLLSRPRTSRANLRRAIALYRKAYRLGEFTAAYNLSCTYMNRGRHRDAVRWFRRAHAAGDPSALLQIALAELYGLGTRRDPKAAFEKLRQMASSRTTYWPPESGENIEAMILIALALKDGWLLPRDHDGYRRWLRRAAAKGSATAKALLQEY